MAKTVAEVLQSAIDLADNARSCGIEPGNGVAIARLRLGTYVLNFSPILLKHVADAIEQSGGGYKIELAHAPMSSMSEVGTISLTLAGLDVRDGAQLLMAYRSFNDISLFTVSLPSGITDEFPQYIRARDELINRPIDETIADANVLLSVGYHAFHTR